MPQSLVFNFSASKQIELLQELELLKLKNACVREVPALS